MINQGLSLYMLLLLFGPFHINSLHSFLFFFFGSYFPFQFIAILCVAGDGLTSFIFFFTGLVYSNLASEPNQFDFSSDFLGEMSSNLWVSWKELKD